AGTAAAAAAPIQPPLPPCHTYTLQTWRNDGLDDDDDGDDPAADTAALWAERSSIIQGLFAPGDGLDDPPSAEPVIASVRCAWRPCWAWLRRLSRDVVAIVAEYVIMVSRLPDVRSARHA